MSKLAGVQPREEAKYKDVQNEKLKKNVHNDNKHSHAFAHVCKQVVISA